MQIHESYRMRFAELETTSAVRFRIQARSQGRKHGVKQFFTKRTCTDCGMGSFLVGDVRGFANA